MDEQDLIHDWNHGTFDWSRVTRVELDDETLRDGLQSPSAVDPPIGDKLRLLHLMDRLGIHSADLGLPGAGPRAVEAVTALAREIVEAKLSIRGNCAARTLLADIRTREAGQAGESLAELLVKVKEVDVDSLSGGSGLARVPLVGRFVDSFNRFATRYQKIGATIDGETVSPKTLSEYTDAELEKMDTEELDRLFREDDR